MEVSGADVVGRSPYPHRRFAVGAMAWHCILAVLLALGMAVAGCMPATAWAEGDGQASDDAQSSSGTYIVDTQNLLGDDFTKVSDAIAQTKEETGVLVRLTYLSSLNTTETPAQWAQSTMKSLDPAPNTVMLVVATDDANLAVVVSPDSDEWLHKQSTVDALSEAAYAPLAVSGNETPDWAASALDMMAAIRNAKATSTSSTASSVGIVILAAVAVLLVAVAIGFFVHRKHRGRHAHQGRSS